METIVLALSLLIAGDTIDHLGHPRYTVRRQAENRVESMQWLLRPALQQAAKSKDQHVAEIAKRYLRDQAETLEWVSEYAEVFRMIFGPDGFHDSWGWWIRCEDEQRLREMPPRVLDTIENIGRWTLLLDPGELPAFRVQGDEDELAFRASVVNVLRNRARFNFELNCCSHNRKALVNGKLVEVGPMPRGEP